MCGQLDIEHNYYEEGQVFSSSYKKYSKNQLFTELCDRSKVKCNSRTVWTSIMLFEKKLFIIIIFKQTVMIIFKGTAEQLVYQESVTQ